MSLQSDIVTALAAVAGGRVYPQVAEQGAAKPFVVYRILSKDPAQKLGGGAGVTNTSVVFDCWAETYAAAIALAEQVRAALDASSLISYEESASGEDYELETDEFVEPVNYGFWHS